MEQIFIEKILINEVRHLHDIEIPLSVTERKHLILTGKNGSGKTSVLEEMKFVIEFILKHGGNKKSQKDIKDLLLVLEKQLLVTTDITAKNTLIAQKESIDALILEKKKNTKIELSFTVEEQISVFYKNGNFIFVYFPAKRNANLVKPTGIQQVKLKAVSEAEDKVNRNFIQYIVNLKVEHLFAQQENDMVSAQKIDAWFQKFEGLLQDIFEEKELKLEFDRKEYNFYIHLPNRERFDFNHLSEGYSALLSIVTEIIIRMEKKSSQLYDIQGVVFIDEVEIHLHVDLQKKILPFLTTFFPNIQFIVTTHSPFVINSISNAVVYDLENNILCSDLSAYSVEAIIKGYLLTDEYSEVVKQKVAEYENLLEKAEMTNVQKENLRELHNYFKQLPKFWSEELDSKIKILELQHISKLKA